MSKEDLLKAKEVKAKLDIAAQMVFAYGSTKYKTAKDLKRSRSRSESDKK